METRQQRERGRGAGRWGAVVVLLVVMVVAWVVVRSLAPHPGSADSDPAVATAAGGSSPSPASNDGAAKGVCLSFGSPDPKSPALMAELLSDAGIDDVRAPAALCRWRLTVIVEADSTKESLLDDLAARETVASARATVTDVGTGEVLLSRQSPVASSYLEDPIAGRQESVELALRSLFNENPEIFDQLRQ